jgi:hypothetical protein
MGPVLAPSSTAASFRWCAAAAFALSAASALLTAAIDAANVTGRFRQTVFDARPYWLHTFSIAMLSTIVGAAALLLLPRRAFCVPARVAYGVTAALNLTVPIVQRRHQEYPLTIPALHVAIALLFVALVVLASEHVRLNRTLDTAHRPRLRRGSQ